VSEEFWDISGLDAKPPNHVNKGHAIQVAIVHDGSMVSVDPDPRQAGDVRVLPPEVFGDLRDAQELAKLSRPREQKVAAHADRYPRGACLLGSEGFGLGGGTELSWCHRAFLSFSRMGAEPCGTMPPRRLRPGGDLRLPLRRLLGSPGCGGLPYQS
jgi:hypothetical protein